MSRFPIFWILAHVFESDDTTKFVSPSCRSDLTLYLHAVLDGTATLDPALVAKVLRDTDMSSSGATVCEQQMLVSIAALGYRSLSAELDELLLGNEARVREWMNPTPWPVWSALHSLWGNATIARPVINPVALSLRALTPTDYTSMTKVWKGIDFNGWDLPGTVLNDVMSTETQDDGWTSTLDYILDEQESDRQQLHARPHTATPRIAFLESRFALFHGTMSFDYRKSESNPVRVPYEVFEEEWSGFLKDADSTTSQHGKVIGNFDKSMLGLIHAWRADFLGWPPEPSESDLDTLAEYDVVIIIDDYPKGRPPTLPLVSGQIRIWQPWEPIGGFYSDFVRRLPPDYCPVVMDIHNAAPPPAVLMHHYYRVSDFQRALDSGSDFRKPSQPEAYIFYSNPAAIADLIQSLKQMGYHVTGASEGASMKTYWHALQRASVAILPPLRSMSRPSCGQAIADAAMANCVPTFSPRTKLFARIIMPAFLSYRSPAELLAKTKLLFDNPDWYNLLSKEVCRRLRYIDVSSAESPLQFMDRLESQAPGDRRCFWNASEIEI